MLCKRCNRESDERFNFSEDGSESDYCPECGLLVALGLAEEMKEDNKNK